MNILDEMKLLYSVLKKEVLFNTTPLETIVNTEKDIISVTYHVMEMNLLLMNVPTIVYITKLVEMTNVL